MGKSLPFSGGVISVCRLAHVPVLQPPLVSRHQSKQALSQPEAASGEDVNLTFEPASPPACLPASGIGQAAYFISNSPQELRARGPYHSCTVDWARVKTPFLRCRGSHCGGRAQHGAPCWTEARSASTRRPAREEKVPSAHGGMVVARRRRSRKVGRASLRLGGPAPQGDASGSAGEPGSPGA